jgi:prepilin-type N-terminal cleavage/methylation domain-containing protein
MKNIFKKRIKNISNSRKGFTLIETLVAIFVLLIATTGPLAFTQSGLQTSFLARDQITAFYLAQESIETIKNIRDHNAIESRTNASVQWTDDFEACTPEPTTISCNIQMINNTLTTDLCTNNIDGKCDPMRYDSINKRFLISGGTENSKYTRTVYISKITDEEMQIVVEVSWQSQFGPAKRIIVQENIFKK